MSDRLVFTLADGRWLVLSEEALAAAGPIAILKDAGFVVQGIQYAGEPRQERF